MPKPLYAYPVIKILNEGIVAAGTDDTTLVARAFGNCLGYPGEIFVVLAVTLFAFTTVICWSYYGSKVLEYLFCVFWAKTYSRFFPMTGTYRKRPPE